MFNFFKDKKSEKQKNNLFNILEFNNFINEIENYRRNTWIPITTDSESRFSPESKFGGLPYLDEQNEWPVCPNCEKHMTFFAQINMGEIPEQNESGLIQLFYCTNYEKRCEEILNTWSPFSKGSVARVIEKIKKEPTAMKHNATKVFPEKKICKWNKKNDYPCVVDYASKLNKIFKLIPDENCQKYEIINEMEKNTLTGEKIFGWPYWVQNAEYPSDPSTGEKMDFIIQIDSNNNIPWMFGDAGIGHITRSKTDKTLLTFSWACG